MSRHKLRPEFPDRDYARLVIMRAMGLFAKITGLSPTRLILTEDEKELLEPVIEPERPKLPPKPKSQLTPGSPPSQASGAVPPPRRTSG